MGRYIAHGATDQSVFVRILATDGTAKTDVTAATGNVAMTYVREGGNATSAGTVGNLASGDAAHSDAGLIHLTAGIYRADPPDAAFASGADEVAITITGDALVCVPAVHPLGPVPANVTQWLGTTVATPTTAGVPEVDVTHVGGSAQDIATATALETVDGNVDTLIERVPGNITITGGRVVADTTAISGNSTSADRLESFVNGDALATLPKTDIQQVNGGATAADDLRTAIEAGISTLDAADVRTAVGLSSANLDTQLADIPTVAEFEARTLPSGNYATAAALTTIDNEIAVIDGIVDNLNLGIIYGAAATGTLSTTQATTDLTGYADDQLIGRVIIWTSGACEGEATDITDYASTGGLLTFTALTTAPGNLDEFKVV